MNVAILTHPLISNYGGILQAWSLKVFLENCGHKCIILDYRVRPSFVKRILIYLLNSFFYARNKNLKKRTLLLDEFIQKNIKRTKKIYSVQALNRMIEAHGIDAIIVGSDQVWRRSFTISRGIGTYFLSFIAPDKSILKVAYAASFAKSEWEYTCDETVLIRNWINEFNAVSVREESAVHLCKDQLSMEAEHTLDPTLLLDPVSFSSLISENPIDSNYVFIYWLGKESDLNEEMKKYNFTNRKLLVVSHKTKTILSMEQWLSAIKFADTVLTDSFHGCVFSIVFKKHFIICRNDDGGNDRLISLFNTLGLEEKLKTPDSNEDYTMIEDRINILRKQSSDFLINALKQQ